MDRKLRVGVLFGGRSTEHAISLISARNVIQALDPNKYEVIPIGISQSGTWLLQTDEIQQLLNASDESIHQAELSLHAHPQNSVTLVQRDEGQALLNLSGRETLHYIDVVFPVLHGPYGEDGTIQGLLKTAQVPFVGAGVLASAAGMDKDVMKRLLRDAGLPIARFVCVHRHQRANLDTEAIIQDLKLPLFVKPANAGSSVGVSKVKTPAELGPAIDAALRYDHKILIEEAIAGREIECAVLGNETPQASIAGELKPKGEFYSYEAKYIEADGAQLIIPAPITPVACAIVSIP